MTLTDAVVYNSVLIVLGAWSKACRTGFVGGAGALMGWGHGGREGGGREVFKSLELVLAPPVCPESRYIQPFKNLRWVIDLASLHAHH